MLETENLSVFYGRHRAVEGVTVEIGADEIVVMLGANGAGKSTLLRAISGLTPASPESKVRLDGKDISGRPAHEIVEAGLALVPEDRGLFADLTVYENLILGAQPKRARSHESKNLKNVLDLFPRLDERRQQIVRTMSGGERQMVAVGRAMMSAPKILMLDEPSLGLSPILCTELFRSLIGIKETGVGVFLVEQNARLSLSIADRGYLLDNGHIAGADTAAALANDRQVIDAYLGGAGARDKQAPALSALEVPVETHKISVAGRGLIRHRVDAMLPGGIDTLVAKAVTADSARHQMATNVSTPPITPVVSDFGTSKLQPTNVTNDQSAMSDELQTMLNEMERSAANALAAGNPTIRPRNFSADRQEA